jgi:Fe-S-cluster containining protein
MIAYATDTDIERWKQEERHDILDRVQDGGLIWAGDTIISARGATLSSCVFLNWDGNVFFCDIYETRPQVCRDFKAVSSELCPLYTK